MWQPHQIWSYGPMNSAMFHGFGLGWLICGTITPEPYQLWTWDLHHWIQQRLRFKRICGAKSPEPYILWTWDLHHWMQQRLMCYDVWLHIQLKSSWIWFTSMGEFVQTSLCCESYSYNLCILTQQGFRSTLYLCGMVSHTMITLALLSIPTHPPDYTLIIKLCLYLMLEPCHTNLTFLLTLYQHGAPTC